MARAVYVAPDISTTRQSVDVLVVVETIEHVFQFNQRLQMLTMDPQMLRIEL